MTYTTFKIRKIKTDTTKICYNKDLIIDWSHVLTTKGVKLGKCSQFNRNLLNVYKVQSTYISLLRDLPHTLQTLWL